MVLGVDLPVFYGKYQNFLQALADAITEGGNINLVSVNSITQGSTILNAQIITDANSGSNLADQQFTALQQLTESGSSIAGMNVESSQLSVNGGTAVPDETGSSTNLGLILGICIPVGVLRTYFFILVIALIIYCVFRQRKFRHPPTSAEMTDTTGRGMREEFEMK